MNNNKHAVLGSVAFAAIGALVILVLAAALVFGLATSGYHSNPEQMTAQAKDARLQPTGTILLGDGVPVGHRGGEMIFNKVCIQCHAADLKTQNSPKLNDKAEWAPRIAQGFETLFVHARDGFKNNTMPARGGMTPETLTDDELKRAVAYMANSAGAAFTEPPIVNASETAAAAATAAN